MRTFELGQRVLVLAEVDCLAPPPSSPEQDALAGKTGTVVRLRRADEAAWVRMNCNLPQALRSFPADDEHGRGNHIMLWPQWCREVRKTPNAGSKRAAEGGPLERPVRALVPKREG